MFNYDVSVMLSLVEIFDFLNFEVSIASPLLGWLFSFVTLLWEAHFERWACFESCPVPRKAICPKFQFFDFSSLLAVNFLFPLGSRISALT